MKKIDEITYRVLKAAQTNDAEEYNPNPASKESEGERIKREILELVSIAGNGNQFEEIKDWLEKRGEQKPNYCHHEVDLSRCSEEYKKAYYDGWNNCNMQHSQCKSELDDVLKCLINGMKFYYEDNKDATWGTYKWSMPVKHIIEVLEKQGEQKPVDKVEPRFKVKYAGSEYNVLEVKDIAGVTFYGIEDEPNHIDYVKAENCEIISGYAIKENGSPYPTKPAVFSEKKPTAWLYDQACQGWIEDVEVDIFVNRFKKDFGPQPPVLSNSENTGRDLKGGQQ